MSDTEFRAADHAEDGKQHLLLAASGSVATIKLPLMLEALSTVPDLAIRVILTGSASAFLQGQSREQPTMQQIRSIANVDAIYHDSDEWSSPWKRASSILHIELRRWADLFVVAPTSANTLAKLSNGWADNLLLSVARAWDTTGQIDGSRKAILIAPAMNTAMWRHPVTKKQLQILQEWAIETGEHGWIHILPPVTKTLACGDAGDGAMMEWTQVVDEIKLHLGRVSRREQREQ